MTDDNRDAIANRLLRFAADEAAESELREMFGPDEEDPPTQCHACGCIEEQLCPGPDDGPHCGRYTCWPCWAAGRCCIPLDMGVR
jgi:hypothetical protein